MNERAQRQTCKGIKKDGTPCKSPVVLQNGYCSVHQDQAPALAVPEEPEAVEAEMPQTATPAEQKTVAGHALTRREVFSADGLKKAVTAFLGWVAGNIAWDATEPARKELVETVEKPVKELVGDVGDALKGLVEDVRDLVDDIEDRLSDLTPESQSLERKFSWEPELVFIPAGKFLMGSNPLKDPQPFDNEKPQHVLYLPNYWITRTPVTNAQFLAFVQITRHTPPYRWVNEKLPTGKDDHPVVGVSWRDAMAYCNWLAKSTGKPYRLPTEAEWEKAARGTRGRIYPWGDEFDANKCNAHESAFHGTTRVGQYSPDGDSPYGCADMAGNVWEWTSSLYRGYPYRANDGREDPDSSDSRVLRGGAFVIYQRNVRCAARYRNFPYLRFSDFGLRVVVSPISPASAL